MAAGQTGVAVRYQAKTNAVSPLKRFLSRYFYFSMALLMSGLAAVGFSHTLDRRLLHAQPARPILLWLHAAAFGAWMLLFVTQSALVRVRKVKLHRTLGWVGSVLAATMVASGFTIVVVMGRFDTAVLHNSGVAEFLSILLFDMIVFGACMTLAVLWRKKPEYHRRLIVLATCGLMQAAFVRWNFIVQHGASYDYLAVDLLILAGMLRDLVVDGRIHKVYLYALPLIAAGQTLTVYLFRVQPAWWQGITHTILGA